VSDEARGSFRQAGPVLHAQATLRQAGKNGVIENYPGKTKILDLAAWPVMDYLLQDLQILAFLLTSQSFVSLQPLNHYSFIKRGVISTERCPSG
jgi:hypothetical protein